MAAAEEKTTSILCDCGKVKINFKGDPRVTGICHCNACRECTKNPMYSVVAWEPKNMSIVSGLDVLCEWKVEGRKMKRYSCTNCGQYIYNTNIMDWIVTPLSLYEDRKDGTIAKDFLPKFHIFYEYRKCDLVDDLPKYLQGTSGKLFDQEEWLANKGK